MVQESIFRKQKTGLRQGPGNVVGTADASWWTAMGVGPLGREDPRPENSSLRPLCDPSTRQDMSKLRPIEQDGSRLGKRAFGREEAEDAEKKEKTHKKKS